MIGDISNVHDKMGEKGKEIITNIIIKKRIKVLPNPDFIVSEIIDDIRWSISNLTVTKLKNRAKISLNPSLRQFMN